MRQRTQVGDTAYRGLPERVVPPSKAVLKYQKALQTDASLVLLHERYLCLLRSILTVEQTHRHLRAFLPGGKWAKKRKELSHNGTLQDGRDPGNWIYAIVMRTLFGLGLDNHNDCRDVLLGDVIEAMLNVVGCKSMCSDKLGVAAYAGFFNNVCLVLEDLIPSATRAVLWVSSRDMASLLLPASDA